MMVDFSGAPIMLHHSSSLLGKDKAVSMYPVEQACFLDDSDAASDDMTIEVPQNLEPEQFKYEFPPKSRLRALARLYNNTDPEDTHSFFDESSFTTTSTSSVLSQIDDGTDNAFSSGRPSPLLSHSAAGYTNDHLDRFFESVASAFNANQPRVHNGSWDRDMSAYEKYLRDTLLRDNAHLVQHGQYPLFHESICSQYNSKGDTRYRSREQSCDSTATVTQRKIVRQRQDNTAVTQSSVLSPGYSHGCFLDRVSEEGSSLDGYRYSLDYRHNQDNVEQRASRHPLACRNWTQNLPVFESESELQAKDYGSDTSNDSKVVLVRLSRKSKRPPIIVAQRCSTSQTWHSKDEGYDDEVYDEKEPPIQSVSMFYDLSDQEQQQLTHDDLLRTSAAVKIQAAWRGYQCRKARAASQLGSAHHLIVDVVRLCGNIHRKQMTRVGRRIQGLEQKLHEETALRIAFEKAMEDMAILVDQQQKMLYERLEQEISMRQAYEQQMQDAMAQIRPLTARVQKEVKARSELNSMMTSVLEQMQEIKTASQRQAKEDALAKKAIQRKLDDALAEVASLRHQLDSKSPGTPVRSPVRTTHPSPQTSATRPGTAAVTARPSSAAPRPSTVPMRPSSRPNLAPSTLGRSRDVKRPATAHSIMRTPVTRRGA